MSISQRGFRFFYFLFHFSSGNDAATHNFEILSSATTKSWRNYVSSWHFVTFSAANLHILFYPPNKNPTFLRQTRKKGRISFLFPSPSAAQSDFYCEGIDFRRADIDFRREKPEFNREEPEFNREEIEI